MYKIQADKLGHFRMGLIWLAVFTPVFGLVTASVLVVVGMALKELLWDWRMGKGTPEWLYFIHGIEPVALVWFIIHIKDLYLFKQLVNLL